MHTPSFDGTAAAWQADQSAPRVPGLPHPEPRPPPHGCAAPSALGVDISSRLIRAKRPCADGYRWYVRHGQGTATYVELLRALQMAGRAGDASWLLQQFGPTDDVLELDELSDECLVFPGTVRVRGNVDVASMIHVGGHLVTRGGVRAGGDVTVGGDLQCDGALQAEGVVRCASLRLGMPLLAQAVHCAGALRSDSAVHLRGELVVGEQAAIRGTLDVAGHVSCTRSLQALEDVRVGGALRAGHGIRCGGNLTCDGPLSAGWGLRVSGDIEGHDTIQAGESIVCGGALAAGRGYGIYAGLAVREADWEHSGQVVSRMRPVALRSGLWRVQP